MKEKLMKLLKPFQGTKQQKQRLVNFVKENSGSGSDENIAIFDCWRGTFATNTTFTFKLLQGKPKLQDDGCLLALFTSYGGCLYDVLLENSYFKCVEYSAKASDVTNRIFESYNVNIEDFLNLQVGEEIRLNVTMKDSSFQKHRINKNNKSIEYSPLLEFYNFEKYSFVMAGTNDIEYLGKIVEYNNVQKYFIVEINNQKLKYSYTSDGNFAKDITFVEVVTP